MSVPAILAAIVPLVTTSSMPMHVSVALATEESTVKLVSFDFLSAPLPCYDKNIFTAYCLHNMQN